MPFLNTAVRGTHHRVACGYKHDLQKVIDDYAHPTRTLHLDVMTDPFAHGDTPPEVDISGKRKWGAGSYYGLYVAKDAETLINIYDRIQFAVAQVIAGERRESLITQLEDDLTRVSNTGTSIWGEVEELKKNNIMVVMIGTGRTNRTTGKENMILHLKFPT